ncbi:uncharacterized protein HD556DRAFT_1233985 [Suillus plorans]|uniref:C3H1-type domain-containing protein n=1 Tax=Suillus plorans TaxID=116603 RepID=A0A9P7IY78_9AGAM|nr:uncharacterized protein HD556DRAFT_1233985 [Suillus plorans]KAG1797043.1 hypothetical protein HD556DRAFT_1233985 [Suillus plorans]
MSDYEQPSSQTRSSAQRESGNSHTTFFNPKVVERCLKVVIDFRRHKISKAKAVLGIQQILAEATREGDPSFDSGFAHYLEVLDTIRSEEESESFRGSPRPTRTDRGGESREPEEEVIIRGKRQKLTDDELQFCPWVDPSRFRTLSRSQGIQMALRCYEEWSDDPKYYRTKVTTTPGCPKLSTSQWTLLLEGKAVDLDKVFTRRYSTAIDSKQTQSLGKGFELSLSQPTISHKVKSAGDWGIATDIWTRALTFIMPWREEEVREYREYMSDIFGNHFYTVHERVLDFDRAVRLLVEQQKFLRLDDFTRFDGLKSSHLSAFGMVAMQSSHDSGGKTIKDSARGKSQTRGGRGEPCHKWNRGECEKEARECLYFHVCDRGSCRGNHKRGECPLDKRGK